MPFAQPNIAARSGLRQSHLTYYFPTRTDLSAAVARKAIDIQLAAAKAMVAKVKTAQQAASAIVRHENTKVLVALNQAADHEAAPRDLFNELTDGFVTELKVMLEKVGVKADQSTVDLVHALIS